MLLPVKPNPEDHRDRGHDAAHPRRLRSRARADGFDEAIERHWEPGTVVQTHGHPFAARAWVTAGEMWLTQAGQTRHLRPGDTFSLDEDEPHDERYGAEGATYRVSRKP